MTMKNTLSSSLLYLHYPATPNREDGRSDPYLGQQLGKNLWSPDDDNEVRHSVIKLALLASTKSCNTKWGRWTLGSLPPLSTVGEKNLWSPDDEWPSVSKLALLALSLTFEIL